MQLTPETLLDPPFAKDPPVKLNVPAKTLGLVYAIIGAISALLGLFGIFALLGLSGLAVATGAFAGIFWLAVIGVIIGEVGTVIAAWGGYQMYQLKREGKRLVIYGLAVNVVGSLVGSLGGAGDLAGWIVGTAIAFVLYYLVIISRFPGEPPLVPAAAGQGPSAG
jgi:hypothetical protein